MAKLGLSKTIKNKKKEKADIDKIISQIHDEKIKRMTIRMPETLHRDMKSKLALKGISINEYIVNLIQDGLQDI